MSSDDSFLTTAAAIGEAIVSEAVWHRGRCNWMGAVAEPAALPRREYRALGPSLYDGTAGVGLFLAQLAAVIDEPSVRRTAIGALRHAVAHAKAPPPARRDGFHGGTVGIAWAAAQAAALLGVDELYQRARVVLRGPGLPCGPDRCPDLAMGEAGWTVGLLALATAFDDARLVEHAFACGDELLRRATVRGGCWSWAIPKRRYPTHLCGVAHGAAGIGWAMLELFAATGDERFRTAALGAFAYERSWLDGSSGTWPDLRIGGHRRRAPRATGSPTVGTWCYGEAGIALARLRALALLGPGPHAHDADVALETTQRYLGSALPFEIADLSLCHGAGGAADVLLLAARTRGGTWDRVAGLPAELGRVALERHSAVGDDWPCGVDGNTPALFLGLSGIAWLFLRLHDPTIPSPLALPTRC